MSVLDRASFSCAVFIWGIGWALSIAVVSSSMSWCIVLFSVLVDIVGLMKV